MDYKDKQASSPGSVIAVPTAHPPGSGRLVVMSNRAPIRVVRESGRQRIEPTVGGVGTTFLRLLEHQGGLWIAWSGTQKKTPGRLLMPPDADPARFQIIFCPLDERDVSHYYYGMCNRGLWPLMHFMTANCHFSALHWRYYETVNRKFAALAAAESTDNDVIWVQDFHLALVPRMLREQRARAPVGLFWHVPFPPEQIFRVFPWRAELLEGMLGADLIGFHTRSYVVQFLNCCERILGLRVDRTRSEIATYRGPVRVGVFPLGIPADYFANLAATPRVKERTERIRRALRTPHVVLGVDRLDYTKGILERLQGFERFLETNPAYHRKVTLVLIAVPSRTKVADYAALKRELDELVGRIIGHFSSEGWVPIRYLYTQFGAEDLVAYYQAADVALLTPLRDGMNLVAKEYIAAHLGEDGALILSEFAGAAEELTQALLVNPYDIDAIAARIKQALAMAPNERAARMRAMRTHVHRNNLEHWSELFLSALLPERNPAAEASAGY